MKSDLISTQDIVTQYNDNLVLNYESLFLSSNYTQYGISMYNDIIVSKTPKAYNLDEISALFELGSPGLYDSEMSYAKTRHRNFTFTNQCGLIGYRETNLGVNQRTAVPYAVEDVIKSLIVMTDKEWVNGTNVNFGLRNNPDSKILTVTGTVGTQSQINRIFSDMMYDLQETGVTSSENMLFFYSGKELHNFFTSPSGDTTIKARLPLDNVDAQLIKMHSLVDDPQNLATPTNSSIIGIIPNLISTHAGIIPQLLKTGINEEYSYTYYHFIKSSVGVQALEKNSIVIANFDVETV